MKCALRGVITPMIHVLVAGLALSCADATTTAPAESPATVGVPSPTDNGPPTEGGDVDVADFTLDTIEGRTVNLSDYAGKNVVLLDFWATWCAPCLEAMPHLNAIYERHKDRGFVILSISMDGPETVAEVRAFVKRQRLTFPVLLDQESRAVSLYNPRRSAPFSVLIGRNGQILNRHDGYQAGDEDVIEHEITAALEQ